MRKKIKKIIIANLTKDSQPDDEKDAIFMAGSPGAGKSEVALGLVNSYHKHLIIDADEFRLQFPEYNGSNSSLFQKASSWLVDQAFKYVINHGYSFILDATFAILSAEKKHYACTEKWIQYHNFLYLSGPCHRMAIHQSTRAERRTKSSQRNIHPRFLPI